MTDAAPILPDLRRLAKEARTLADARKNDRDLRMLAAGLEGLLARPGIKTEAK